MALSFWIFVNILLRKFVGFSFQGVDEYGGYALAIVAAAGFAKAAFDRAHVRIDVVTRLMPPTGRAVFDVVALAMLCAMMWMISWHAGLLTHESWRMGALASTVLRTPVWIPQLLWTVGLGWFTLVISFQLVWSVTRLVSGDAAAIERAIGQASIEDEVAAEIQEARQRLASAPEEMR